MDYRKHRSQKFWWHFVSFPILWLPLIGVLVLDLLVTIYHEICFPIYGIEKVKRSEYILIMDRNKLAYLNPLEKLGCMYCGYANGFLLYAKEIAGRTEKYWCGITHEGKPGFKAHPDQTKRGFARFGDEKDLKEKYGA